MCFPVGPHRAGVKCRERGFRRASKDCFPPETCKQSSPSGVTTSLRSLDTKQKSFNTKISVPFGGRCVYLLFAVHLNNFSLIPTQLRPWAGCTESWLLCRGLLCFSPLPIKPAPLASIGAQSPVMKSGDLLNTSPTNRIKLREFSPSYYRARSNPTYVG